MYVFIVSERMHLCAVVLVRECASGRDVNLENLKLSEKARKWTFQKIFNFLVLGTSRLLILMIIRTEIKYTITHSYKSFIPFLATEICPKTWRP